MAGTTNAEGGLVYHRMMKFQESYNFNISEGIPKEVLCGAIAPAAYRSYFNNSDMINEISKAICKQYTVNSKSLAEQARCTLNIYAELQFVVPTVRALRAHARENNISRAFQYILTHQPSCPWTEERPPWLQGANHAAEIPFLFGLEAMYPCKGIKPRSEIELSKQMMIYWSNFAKTGNPNFDAGRNAVGRIPKWPKFDSGSMAYMNFTEHPHTGSKLI